MSDAKRTLTFAAFSCLQSMPGSLAASAASLRRGWWFTAGDVRSRQARMLLCEDRTSGHSTDTHDQHNFVYNPHEPRLGHVRPGTKIEVKSKVPTALNNKLRSRLYSVIIYKPTENRISISMSIIISGGPQTLKLLLNRAQRPSSHSFEQLMVFFSSEINA